jgi:hypothetical protein
MKIRLRVAVVVLLSHLTLNERNIPFVNSVKYLGVIFDKKVACTNILHIEMIKAQVFRTFTRVYFLFKSEGLIANIKQSLHKTFRSLFPYACPAWEFAADNHLLNYSACKTKCSAQLEVFQGAHRFAICTLLSNFRIYIYIYDYITKLCVQQAEVI